MALRAHDVIPLPSVIKSVCRGVKRACSARFTPRQTATLQADSVSNAFYGKSRCVGFPTKCGVPNLARSAMARHGRAKTTPLTLGVILRTAGGVTPEKTPETL